MNFSIYKRLVELGITDEDPEKEKFRRTRLCDIKIEIKADSRSLHDYQKKMLESIERMGNVGHNLQAVGRSFRNFGSAISSMHLTNSCRDIDVREMRR